MDRSKRVIFAFLLPCSKVTISSGGYWCIGQVRSHVPVGLRGVERSPLQLPQLLLLLLLLLFLLLQLLPSLLH